MSEVPSDHPPGTIVEEIEPGYRLHDKIVRPARVIISKGKA
jgi:molecular chaperone GrpE